MLMINETGTQGLNVLVVEDESLVLFNLEDVLADLGCRIVGPAMRLPQALELATTAEAVDLAILDVNLAGEPIFSVAHALKARGVQIIFATGYGREGLPEEWQSHIVLMKPYMADDVAKALAQVTSAAEV